MNDADLLLHPLRRDPGSRRRQKVCTDAVDADSRFAYWLDLICAAYVRVDCDSAPEEGFFGEMEFNQLGCLELTQVATNAQHVLRTRAQISRETEDFCLVHVQRQGRGFVKQAGREAVLDPGDFVVYDCVRPYELCFAGDFHEVSVIRLPRSQLEKHVSNVSDLTATAVPGRESGGQLLLTMIDTVRREVDRLHPASLMGVTEGITSIIAAGLRSLPTANATQPSQLHHYHLARIKQYMAQHLRDPELSVGRIAAALGVSTGHVHRLFRGEPVPLARLIWQMRVEACRRDLADRRLSARSISELAYSWGFSDAAHFSRMFRDEYGQSPREWRAEATATAPVGPDGAANQGHETSPHQLPGGVDAHGTVPAPER